MSKAYGLIVPGKQNKKPTADAPKPSVFGDDSEESSSDNDLPKVRGKFKVPIIGPGAAERRQARSIQQKALAEDPTIFQYDELYDEIENKRTEEKAKSVEEKKPKYIGRLLQQAERRKLENERRVERQVQKEREAEGEEFKDKESFVTSAYKQKLEELKKAEEAEKREDYLEAIGDVRKQGNLDGFYRHLYEQKLGPKEAVTEPVKKHLNEDSAVESKTDSSTKQNVKSRTYRKRQSSDDEDETENISIKKAHIQSNLDADSDFSIDDSSSEDENEKSVSKKPEIIHKEDIKVKVEPATEVNKEVINNDAKEASNTTNFEIKEEPKEETEIEEKPKPKEKIDIWKKRTVGDVFDAALQRYYERKSAKNG